MDFLSTMAQLDAGVLGLLLLPLVPVLLLVIYVMYGVVTALLMLNGRWKTEIISGRFESMGKIVDTQSIHTYENAVIMPDDQAQPRVFKKLLLGSYLRKANALRLGGRFILLLRTKGKGSGPYKAKLLGLSNGREIHCSSKDIRALGRLDWAQAFFLAIFASIPGFILLTPPLMEREHVLAAILAGLACGLIPAVALIVFYNFVAAKFEMGARAQLEQFALNWRAEDETARSKALPPLAAASGMETVSTAAGLATFGLPFLFLKWFAQLLTVFGSAFANPAFEMRPLRISEHGEAHKDAGGSIYLKNVVLQDPFSGVRKKVKVIRPAANLIKAGLFDQGLEGTWMIQAEKLGHPATEETKGSLKVAAYVGDVKNARIHLNLFDVLGLYNYTPFVAPLAAGLTGVFIGAIVIIGRTETLATWVDFLWLIPAAVLPASIMIMARRRIVAAVGKCFQNWSALNGSGSNTYEIVSGD